MVEDDIILFNDISGVTAVGSTFNDASFEDKKFMATSVPTATTITITMPANETGTPLNNSGDGKGAAFYHVGPSQQLGGFGWGTANFGGTASGIATTTLATALTNTTTTDIVITNSTAFPDSGEIRIGTEDISYTNNDQATGTLSGGARGVNGTTKALHSGGVTVSNISAFVAWGDASSADFTIDPGLWVLDNYGTKLIALIYNGKCFEWNAAAVNAMSASLNSFSVEKLDTTGIVSYTSAMERLVEVLGELNDALSADNKAGFGTGTNAGDVVSKMDTIGSGGGAGSDQLNNTMQRVEQVLTEIRDFDEEIKKNTSNITGSNLALGNLT
jgi:hypothetical protein